MTNTHREYNPNRTFCLWAKFPLCTLFPYSSLVVIHEQLFTSDIFGVNTHYLLFEDEICIFFQVELLTHYQSGGVGSRKQGGNRQEWIDGSLLTFFQIDSWLIIYDGLSKFSRYFGSLSLLCFHLGPNHVLGSIFLIII